MNYGLPYKGSKSLLAPWVVEHLPSAGVLVDLFCGGCAVTHAAMLSGRWGRFVANDICGAVPRAFRDATEGKFRGEERWISREDFLALKDTDGYVRCCWSFGNDGMTYLYSREVEPYKRALHHAVFWRDYGPLRYLMPEVSGEVERRLNRLENRKERRVGIGKAIVSALKALPVEERARLIEGNALYKQIKREKTERLESLESLERLERLERLEISSKDYREVELPDDCVVYCDPPYKGTGGYNGRDFDSEAFWEWCRDCPHPVYVSEYNAPEDFTIVAERKRQSRVSATANNKVTERLYCNRKPIETTLF